MLGNFSKKLEDMAHGALLKLDAEQAHSLGKWAMKHGLFAPGPYRNLMALPTTFLGFPLDNPLGLAAGFDKNGELVDSVRNYGFGFIEVGSVTYEGSEGNDKPRLFRLGEGNLLNRMGLNGDPAEVVFKRLQKTKDPFGLSIAKTPINSPNIEAAIEDIAASYDLAEHYLGNKDNLMYVMLNVSCPNTEDGKNFLHPEYLGDLLREIEGIGKFKPLGIKLPPSLTMGTKDLQWLVRASEDYVDCYEAVNTLPMEHSEYGKGGLSGFDLKEQAVETVSRLREQTDKPIIGVGGICEDVDMYGMDKAGADLFLAYTGFVYKTDNSPEAGPRFAHSLNLGWEALKEFR